MSEEVFVQVDNKNNGRLVMGLTLTAVLAIGGTGVTIGRFGQRVETLEIEVRQRAPTNEVKLGFENLQYQLSQVQAQMSDIQTTLRISSLSNARRLP